jgi:tRNA A-37 threonylcarbamoyl transferase component Bud32
MTPSLIGRYEVKKVIGRGGMASVYLAYDPRFERQVAIKVLPSQYLDDPVFRARFQREARTIAALDHPAIVSVYDFGEEGGQPYLVMRLMSGASLADHIAKGALSLEEVLRIVKRLAPALDEVHTKGIIHRDLKPGNILIDQRNEPCLADFGIVKVNEGSSHVSTAGSIVGTPAYMSPEQIQGFPLDGRSDLYSMGAIIFQALSGRLPFEADTAVGLAMKHLTEPVPNILELRPELPPYVQMVIMKAMAKQRGDRYKTAAELVQALETAVQTSAPVTRPQAAADPTVAIPRQQTVVQQPAPVTRMVPQPQPTQQAQPAQPAAPPARPGRSRLWATGLVVLLLLFCCVGGAAAGYTAYQSGSLLTFLATATTQPVAEVTETSPPATATLTTTSKATEAPEGATAVPTTPVPDTPVAATETVAAVPTLRSTSTATPTETPTETPTVTATSTPTTMATSPPASGSGGGLPLTFETFGSWGRGSEANGTFEQSSEQAHGGGRSGKLSYTFGTADNDYVVFLQTNEISGNPTTLEVWVYGDGEGHYLNAWIVDTGGQTWQVPLGRVTHSGWGLMSGQIEVGQSWPWTHISGPNNELVDYPIRFRAFVLDDVANDYVGDGAIYLDDLATR